MKYLKNKILSCLVLLSLQMLFPHWVGAEEKIRFFNASLSEGHKVQIKLEAENYWSSLNGGEWRLLKVGVLEGGLAKEVLFLDVTGDGIKDVFVKLFESGANSVYALFVTSLKDNVVIFTEASEVFGSPYINDQGELVSVKRNGPFSTIEIYKTEDGRFYRYELREPINSELERVTIFEGGGVDKFSINLLGTNTIAVACVSAVRAYLSKVPSSLGITGSYLVKGDSVSVLDSDVDGEWFKIRNGETDAWLSQDMLSFNGLNRCDER